MSSTPHKKNVVENSTFSEVESIHIGDKVTYIINEQKVGIPHLLTNNIPSNADHILGRETELETITNHLAQNKPTVLVNGIGGIGKTSVAAKYVATHRHEYKHLAWLTVQSSVAEAFTNDIVLLKSLHIEQDVRQLIETQRLTDAFKLVVHKLNTLESTLVVLDNANNLADLVEYKNLFDTAKCHYLITSRTQPQEWTIVEIDHLPPDEAVDLFRKLAPSVLATNEELKSLLSKLFYHTLLIELVAKAVENAGFSFAELQTMIENKFIHDAQLNEDIVSTGKHGDSVTDNAKRAKIEEYIWLIFSHVKDLGDDAKQILRGMALLPVATPIDRDFLKKHLALFDVKEIVPNLSLLVEWGWLEKEQNKSFKMHPLVADVVVEHLGVDVRFAEAYIKDVAYLMYYQNTNSETNIFELNKKKPLAERLTKLFIDENTEGMSELFRSLLSIDWQFGFYYKAVEYGERALQIAEDIFDENHPFISECQNDLANVYSNLGQYRRGADLLEKALKSDLTNFADDHPTVAIRQSNLGDACRNLGQYERASILLKISLENELKNFGQGHPTVAASQSSLALLYHQLGNHADAAVLLESALESDKKNFGTDSPKVAIRQSNLGDVYRHLFEFDKAADLLETALVTDLKNFGEEHPNIAFRQHNLALVYINVGRENEAKVLWQAAYQNFLKNFGAEHPHTIHLKKYAEM